MRANSTLLVLTLTAAMAAVSVAPAHAQGSRLSLAERVQRLESQAQGGGQNTMDLLNRITELQAENGVLRGLVEQQNFEIEELKNRQRDQYIDIDSRLSRLEGGGLSAPASPEQLSEEPIAPPADDYDRPMEPPELREPLDSGVLSQTLEGEVAAGEAEPALPVGDPREERLAYESAFEALKDGRYAESARRFQSFLDLYPSGEYAPNALYWLGESYYVTQNYAVAQEQFQRLLEAHPRSSKAPDALLKLGYTHYELRQWPQAEQVLNDVVRRYPDTTVSRLAQGRLRALMLESRR
jgi:tol-pal system protein YbgF